MTLLGKNISSLKLPKLSQNNNQNNKNSLNNLSITKILTNRKKKMNKNFLSKQICNYS